MAKAFLFLPETDNEILEIVTDYQNFQSSFKFLVQEVQKTELELTYQPENIKIFCAKIENCIEPEHTKNRTKRNSIENQFRYILNKRCTEHNEKFDSQYIYFQWLYSDNFKILQTSSYLSKVAERCYDFRKESNIVLNIQKAIPTDRSNIVIFRDDYKDISPNEFIHLEYITDVGDFELWWHTNHIKTFSLKDTKRFKTTKYKRIKQRIYQEVETFYFWYFDFYHKDNRIHYEVFDKEGNGIGEANEIGKIFFFKTGKSISEILHGK